MSQSTQLVIAEKVSVFLTSIRYLFHGANALWTSSAVDKVDVYEQLRLIVLIDLSISASTW